MVGILLPLAGWMGSHLSGQTFFYGSLIGLVLLIAIQSTLKPQSAKSVYAADGFSHKHEHTHDEVHQHEHSLDTFTHQPHSHSHFHTELQGLFEHNSRR